MTKMQRPPERLYSLDVLRGITTLGIVVYHWQHFLFVGTVGPSYLAIAQQPLFNVLFFFYREGLILVDLFFCLSGFVFYWLYSQPISNGSTSARDFFVLRLSRLYPLHLLTLLWVVLGQAAYHHLTNAYFVYPHNDLYHFALNLFLASSWRLERGFSFNGPTWAISVLIAVYGLFFLLCRVLPIRAVVPAVASASGFFLEMAVYSPLGRGVGWFFLGGYVYLTYARIIRTARAQKVRRFLPGLVAGSWILAVAAVHNGWDSSSQHYVALIVLATLVAVAFPLTILTLALLETQRGSLGSRLSVLGDLSYSAYLLHFPLQLSIVTITTWMGIESSIFYSPLALAGFLVLLVAISHASWSYVERPARRLIRAWWLTARFSGRA